MPSTLLHTRSFLSFFFFSNEYIITQYIKRARGRSRGQCAHNPHICVATLLSATPQLTTSFTTSSFAHPSVQCHLPRRLGTSVCACSQHEHTTRREPRRASTHGKARSLAEAHVAALPRRGRGRSAGHIASAQSRSAQKRPTERLTHQACGFLVGSSSHMTKLVEWPDVDRVPARASVL